MAGGALLILFFLIIFVEVAVFTIISAALALFVLPYLRRMQDKEMANKPVIYMAVALLLVVDLIVLIDLLENFGIGAWIDQLALHVPQACEFHRPLSMMALPPNTIVSTCQASSAIYRKDPASCPVDYYEFFDSAYIAYPIRKIPGYDLDCIKRAVENGGDDCQLISDDAAAQFCGFSVGAKEGVLSSCDRYSESAPERQGCILAVAANHDADCGSLKNSLERRICEDAKVFLDGTCDRSDISAPSPDAFDCIALASADDRICDMVYEKNNNLRCRMSAALAASDYSESVCRNVSTANLRMRCCHIYWYEHGQDLVDISIRELCYYRVAIHNQNPELCDMTGRRIGECYTEIAGDTGNASLCGDLQNLYREAGKCYQDLAAKTSNQSICAYLSSSSDRDSCYRDRALNLVDPSICGYMESTSIRDNECYDRISYQTSNSSICDFIETDYVQQRCYDRFDD